MSLSKLQEILKDRGRVGHDLETEQQQPPPSMGFPGRLVVKNLPAMKETWVWSLGQEDTLEKETATHSSIHAWEIPGIEDPGGYTPWGHKRVGHDLAIKEQQNHLL